MQITNNGITSISNGLTNAFSALAKARVNAANAETNRLRYGASMQRALAGVDNLNAKTALSKQKLNATQAVLDAVKDLTNRDNRNETISAVNGKVYTPMRNIGTTGAVFNAATGEQQFDPSSGLGQLYALGQAALRNKNNAAAAASMASVGQRNAARDLTIAKMLSPERYRTGGTGSAGSTSAKGWDRAATEAGIRQLYTTQGDPGLKEFDQEGYDNLIASLRKANLWPTVSEAYDLKNGATTIEDILRARGATQPAAPAAAVAPVTQAITGEAIPIEDGEVDYPASPVAQAVQGVAENRGAPSPAPQNAVGQSSASMTPMESMALNLARQGVITVDQARALANGQITLDQIERQGNWGEGQE